MTRKYCLYEVTDFSITRGSRRCELWQISFDLKHLTVTNNVQLSQYMLCELSGGILLYYNAP